MEKRSFMSSCSDVMRFTAQQNAKASGFKKSTIIVGFIIALICVVANIIMAVSDDEDTTSAGIDGESDEMEIDNESLGLISKILFVDDNTVQDEAMKNLITSSLTLEGMAEEKLLVEIISESEMKDKISQDTSAMAVQARLNEDGRYEFNIYIKDKSDIDESIAEVYMDYVIMYIDSACYQVAGVTAEEILCMEAPYFTQSLSVNEEAEGMAITLTEMFVPMIFTMLMYAMVLMHGQSISRSVVSEKTSKLMEYLLTSIRPYALIFGKVLALSGMAVLQLCIWIVCGVAGWFIGATVAENINPGYTNYVSLIIDAMGAESIAFSAGAVILAFVAVLAGFILYCVLAALVGAAISKIEDMSSAMTWFQLPVVIGWMVAYIVPLLRDDTLNTIISVVPVTSPFILPAFILIGKCSILEGILSLAIILISICVLVFFTGKVYKGKLFNRK